MSADPLWATRPGFPGPVPVTPTPTTPGLTIEQSVRAAWPWWPEALLTKLVDAWTRLGDVDLALAEVRKDPAYEQFFPRNRRPDGTLRLSEQDYYSVVTGYRNVLRSYGLDPTEFEARGLFGEAIANERSVAEISRSVSAAWSTLEADLPALRSWYADNYGLGDLSDTAIFAAAIDPTISEDLRNLRLTSAQIGGLASTFGFDRSRQEAERLAGMGVDRQRAVQGYSQAARDLPTLDELAGRWGDTDADVDIGEFEEAVFEGDAEQARRFERLLRAEQSSFGGRTGVRQDREGALVGLRPR